MLFSASIPFRSEVTNRAPSESLWEESIVLVSAQSEDDALVRATAIGKQREHSYPIESGEELRWIFDRVERIYTIDAEALESGTELFSRYLRASEVESLLTPFTQ